MLKNKKLIFMLFTLACFVAMGVCLIVDMAITKQITWSAYPLISIPFGWVAVSPLLIKKYGKILCPCVLTLSVLPYLYFLEKVTPVSDWFFPLGLPSAVTGIVVGWVIYFLFRFIRISIWYKASICVFIAGVIASPITNHFVNAYTQTEPSFLNNFINVFSCIVASAILGIFGYRTTKAKTESKNQ